MSWNWYSNNLRRRPYPEEGVQIRPSETDVAALVAAGHREFSRMVPAQAIEKQKREDDMAESWKGRAKLALDEKIALADKVDELTTQLGNATRDAELLWQQVNRQVAENRRLQNALARHAPLDVDTAVRMANKMVREADEAVADDLVREVNEIVADSLVREVDNLVRELE
jgi:regulator of replication initiation timing